MQRGFNWVGLVAILAGVALVLFAADWGFAMYKRQLADADTNGHQRGVAEMDAAYKARDNQQLAAAGRQIEKLLLENQDLQSRLSKANQQIAQRLEKEKNDARKDAESFLARLDSGALRLREGVVEVGPCADDRPAAQVGISVPDARAAASGAPRRACAKFSPATERFLVGLALEADAVVLERNSCVAIGQNDRAELERLAAERRK